MAFDWLSRRGTATMLITKYGQEALLRRDGDDDRDCVVYTESYSSSHAGNLRNDPTGFALISTDDLDPPPDAEKDHLVLLDQITFDEVGTLRLIAPVSPFGPGGVTTYFEVRTRQH